MVSASLLSSCIIVNMLLPSVCCSRSPLHLNNNAAGMVNQPRGDQQSNTDPMKEEETPPNFLESLIRQLTPHREYHFGDITKTAANITVNATKTAKEGLETAIETFVQRNFNEDYEFGDITKSVSKRTAGATKTAAKVASKAMSLEVRELTRMLWDDALNGEQRREALALLIYPAAVGVLAYNVISNIFTGAGFILLWRTFILRNGVSPLDDGGGSVWIEFYRRFQDYQAVVDGLLLPARVALAIPLFGHYYKFVERIRKCLPGGEMFSISTKIVSILMAWVIANIGVVGGISFASIWMISERVGVPVFST